jgi:hypothetical protein
MRTVHRAVVDGPGIIRDISMPRFAKVEHVGAIGDGSTGAVEFWYEVDTDTYPRPRGFMVTGTGQPAATQAEYLGCTGRTESGLVWHLWEV